VEACPAEGGKSLPTIEATEVSKQTLCGGENQECRLFLSTELETALAGFVASNLRHHLVVHLQAVSSDPEVLAVTVQRSYLKIVPQATGSVAQIVQQFVQCGTVVRKQEALYGVMPNPRPLEKSPVEVEGGDCVICLTNARDVVILHCRHVCLCRNCATITSSTWSFQCPVCRGRVAAMVEIEEKIH